MSLTQGAEKRRRDTPAGAKCLVVISIMCLAIQGPAVPF